jgi:hypothetical protein
MNKGHISEGELSLQNNHAKALMFLQENLNPEIAQYFKKKQLNSDFQLIDSSAPQHVRNIQALLNLVLIVDRALPLYSGYKIQPITQLSSINEENVQAGILYLYDNGNYLLRDVNGKLIKDSFEEILDSTYLPSIPAGNVKKISFRERIENKLDNLDKKLQDEEFKAAFRAQLLSLTSARGQTLYTNPAGGIVGALLYANEWRKSVNDSLDTLSHFNLETSPETYAILSLLRTDATPLFNLFSQTMPETNKLCQVLSNLLGTTVANSMTSAIGRVSDYFTVQKQHESNQEVVEGLAKLVSPKRENGLAINNNKTRYKLNPVLDGEITTALKGLDNTLHDLNDALSFNRNAASGKLISGLLEGILQHREILNTIDFASKTAVEISENVRVGLREEAKKIRPLIKEAILNAVKMEDELGLRSGYLLEQIEPFAKSYFDFTKKLDISPAISENQPTPVGPLSKEETETIDAAKDVQYLEKKQEPTPYGPANKDDTLATETAEEDELFISQRLKIRKTKLTNIQNELQQLKVLKEAVARLKELLYDDIPITALSFDILTELRSLLPLLDKVLPYDIYGKLSSLIDSSLKNKESKFGFFTDNAKVHYHQIKKALPIRSALSSVVSYVKNVKSAYNWWYSIPSSTQQNPNTAADPDLQDHVSLLIKDNITQIESYQKTLETKESCLIFTQLHELLTKKPLELFSKEDLAFCVLNANKYLAKQPDLSLLHPSDQELEFLFHYGDFTGKPPTIDSFIAKKLDTIERRHSELLRLQSATNPPDIEVSTDEVIAEVTLRKLAEINQQISARNIKMADVAKECRRLILKNIQAYFSETVVNNINESFSGYELCLASELANNDYKNIAEGKIYLCDDGEYLLRTLKGTVSKVSFRDLPESGWHERGYQFSASDVTTQALSPGAAKIAQLVKNNRFKVALLAQSSRNGDTLNRPECYEVRIDDPQHVQDMKNFMSALAALEDMFRLGNANGSYYLAAEPITRFLSIVSKFHLNFEQQRVLFEAFFEKSSRDARSIVDTVTSGIRSELKLKAEETPLAPAAMNSQEQTRSFLDFYNKLFIYPFAINDFLKLETKEEVSSKLDLLPYADTIRGIRESLERFLQDHFDMNFVQTFTPNETSGLYDDAPEDSAIVKDQKSLLNTLSHLAKATQNIDAYLNGSLLDLFPAIESISVSVNSLTQLNLQNTYKEIGDLYQRLLDPTAKLINEKINPFLSTLLIGADNAEQAMGLRQGVFTYYIQSLVNYYQTQCDNINLPISRLNEDAFFKLRNAERGKSLLAAKQQQGELEMQKEVAEKRLFTMKLWLKCFEVPSNSIERLRSSIKPQIQLLGSEITQKEYLAYIEEIIDNKERFIEDKDVRLNELFGRIRSQLIKRHALLKANFISAERKLDLFNATVGFSADVARDHMQALLAKAPNAVQARLMAKEVSRQVRLIKKLLDAGELGHIENKIKHAEDQLMKARDLATKSQRGSVMRKIGSVESKIDELRRELDLKLKARRQPVPSKNLSFKDTIYSLFVALIRFIVRALDAIAYVFGTWSSLKKRKPPLAPVSKVMGISREHSDEETIDLEHSDQDSSASSEDTSQPTEIIDSPQIAESSPSDSSTKTPAQRGEAPERRKSPPSVGVTLSSSADRLLVAPKLTQPDNAKPGEMNPTPPLGDSSTIKKN